MGEFTEFLKFLYGAGTSIIPWILLAVTLYLIISLKPSVSAYLKTKENTKKAQIEKEGERNEVIRNCSATIEACTAVLEMTKNDRMLVINNINEHERMSQERMERIQSVVDECKTEIVKARGEIKGISNQLK